MFLFGSGQFTSELPLNLALFREAVTVYSTEKVPRPPEKKIVSFWDHFNTRNRILSIAVCDVKMKTPLYKRYFFYFTFTTKRLQFLSNRLKNFTCVSNRLRFASKRLVSKRLSVETTVNRPSRTNYRLRNSHLEFYIINTDSTFAAFTETRKGGTVFYGLARHEKGILMDSLTFTNQRRSAVCLP